MSVYEEIEARTGRDPSVPAVHVTLRRLQDKGLLASRLGTPSPRGGRPRRYYSATPAGTESLLAFRTMWRGLWRGMELPDPEAPT
jgi:DNA-binding PadR family transcriptional regulator